jgi:hypothetical protein
MKLFRAKVIERPHPSQVGAEDRVVANTLVTASTIGKALDFLATDPAEGAVFEIEYLGQVEEARE